MVGEQPMIVVNKSKTCRRRRIIIISIDYTDLRLSVSVVAGAVIVCFLSS